MDEKFWLRVNKTDTCWLYTGPAKSGSYGRYWDVNAKKSQWTHRYAWTLLKGKIPYGMELHHKCLIKICVNPDHLELVTRASHPDTANNIQKNKTHCNHGHKFTPENTRIYRGHRRCKTCCFNRNNYGNPKGI